MCCVYVGGLLLRRLLQGLRRTLSKLSNFNDGINVSLSLQVLMARTIVRLFRHVRTRVITLITTTDDATFSDFKEDESGLLIKTTLLRLIRSAQLNGCSGLLLITLLNVKRRNDHETGSVNRLRSSTLTLKVDRCDDVRMLLL